MACDYLAERGYQRMATVTFVDRAYSAERTGAFIDSVQEQNLQVQELEMSDRQWDYTRVPQRSGLLVPWLKELEPPVGMFASNDETGRHISDACRMADLRVPEDVGILSVDNDEVLCELANPPLSSIELGAERIGYAAARLMARLLRSKKEDAPAPVLVDPVAVVTRRSSDHYAVEDELVNEALRYIWEHAAEGISVDDLVQTLDVSRRWLEVRFRRAIQCSPAARIRQVQVEKAKKLLAETDLLIPDVAEAAGFGDAKLLIAVFRRLVGMQPTAYRRRYSLR
jgi:LacI family transcriptional regulator